MGFGHEAFEERVGGLRHIGLDTCACIYFLAREQPFVEAIRQLFERADARRLAISLSRIVQLELLIRPLQNQDLREREIIVDLTERAAGVETTDLTRGVAFLAAEIRARTGLKVPDAIVVASSAMSGCEAIVGNDKKFRSIDALRGVRLMGASSRPVAIPQYVHLDDFRQEPHPAKQGRR